MAITPGVSFSCCGCCLKIEETRWGANTGDNSRSNDGVERWSEGVEIAGEMLAAEPPMRDH